MGGEAPVGQSDGAGQLTRHSEPGGEAHVGESDGVSSGIFHDEIVDEKTVASSFRENLVLGRMMNLDAVCGHFGIDGREMQVWIDS